eukprot:12918511-Prorocentrum_lima.AAC.1
MSQCHSTFQVDMKNHFDMLCYVPWNKLIGYILHQCDNAELAGTFAECEEMIADRCKTSRGSRSTRGRILSSSA